MLLNDRRIWITGASSGIGKACAIRMAGLGAKIAQQKAAIVFPAMVSIVFKLLACLPEATSSRLMDWLAPTHIRYRQQS